MFFFLEEVAVCPDSDPIPVDFSDGKGGNYDFGIEIHFAFGSEINCNFHFILSFHVYPSCC